MRTAVVKGWSSILQFRKDISSLICNSNGHGPKAFYGGIFCMKPAPPSEEGDLRKGVNTGEDHKFFVLCSLFGCNEFPPDVRRRQHLVRKNMTEEIVSSPKLWQPHQITTAGINRKTSGVIMDDFSLIMRPGSTFDAPLDQALILSSIFNPAHSQKGQVDPTNHKLWTVFKEKERDMSSVNTNIELATSGTGEEHEVITKTYRRRFWILLVFAMLTGFQVGLRLHPCEPSLSPLSFDTELANGQQWNTWGPIGASMGAAYPGWGSSTVAMMANWGPITFLIFVAPMCWLMNTRGLRVSVVTCATMMSVGTLLRCIPAPPAIFTALCHVCAFLVGTSGTIMLAAPPLLAADWFPPQERTTATARNNFSKSLYALAIINAHFETKANAYECCTDPCSLGIEQDVLLSYIKTFCSTRIVGGFMTGLALRKLSCMRYGELCNYCISPDVLEDILMYPQYQMLQCLSTPKPFHISSVELDLCHQYKYLRVIVNDAEFIHNLKKRLWERLKPLRTLPHIALSPSIPPMGPHCTDQDLLDANQTVAQRRQRCFCRPYTCDNQFGRLSCSSEAVPIVANQVGSALSYLEARVVRAPGDSVTPADIRSDVTTLLSVEAGIAAALLVMTVAYFPSRPSSPPSITSAAPRLEYRATLAAIARNRDVLLVFASYGLSSIPWEAVLSYYLSTLGIQQDEASWLGFVAVVASAAAGLLAARLNDLIYGHALPCVLALMLASIGAFYWLCLLSWGTIAVAKWQVYTSVIGGMAVNLGATSLFVELAVELAYPCPEGVVTGFMEAVPNVTGAIFLFLFFIPDIGYTWVVYYLLGSCVACVLPLLLVKEEYARSSIDRRRCLGSFP
nr:uncharacterized protein LOC113821995 [Penaeus vannamei]